METQRLFTFPATLTLSLSLNPPTSLPPSLPPSLAHCGVRMSEWLLSVAPSFPVGASLAAVSLLVLLNRKHIQRTVDYAHMFCCGRSGPSEVALMRTSRYREGAAARGWGRRAGKKKCGVGDWNKKKGRKGSAERERDDDDD